MNPDLEEQLRLTLQGRAGNVADSRDLSRAAIDRSREIRRNRTRLTVAASVAAVAAIVPAVLFTGDRLSGTETPIAPPSSVSPTAAPTPTPVPTPGASSSVAPVKPSNPAGTGSPKAPAPTKVTLDLTKLARGEAPRTAYLDGRSVVTPDGRARVPGTGIITQAIQTGGRVFALTVPSDGSSGSLMFDLPIGGGSGSQVPDVSDLRASADGDAGAYAITRTNDDGSPVKGSTLHYRSGSTRSELALPAAYGVDIHAVAGNTVYFNTLNSRQERGVLRRWTAGERTSATIGPVRSPLFVSTDRQVAGTSIDEGGDYQCSGLIGLSDRAYRWRTCDYTLHGLAGDAVLVTTIPGDGYADEVFAVLDAGTGKLRHEWRARIPRIAVESDDSVLAEVEQAGEHALVRCTVSTGECELATPHADGAGPDEPRRYRLGS